MEQKILKKICPHCGKEIISLYEEQLESNYKVHLINCEKRKEKNGEERG